MALFGVLKIDEAIFLGDKTRLDVSQSFATPDEEGDFTLEVKADAAADFIEVSSKKYLDWLYSSKDEKTVTIRVTVGESSQEFPTTITVLDPAEEKFLAQDSDLAAYEPSYLTYLPKKWSSFNVVHYHVRNQILKFIADRGIKKCDGTAVTIDDLTDITEFNDVAVCMALALIFEGVKTQVGDTYSEKAKFYADLAVQKSQTAITKIDLNGDGQAEELSPYFSTMRRI